MELQVATTTMEYGFGSARRVPFLVAEVHYTQGDVRSGVAIHFALRALQYHDGPVDTRLRLEDEEPTRPRRRGDLVLWQDSFTGYVAGANAVRELEPHIASIVQRFFVTLYAARR